MHLRSQPETSTADFPRCGQCGYVLVQEPSPRKTYRCPECGTEQHMTELIAAHNQPPKVLRESLILRVSLAAFVVGVWLVIDWYEGASPIDSYVYWVGALPLIGLAVGVVSFLRPRRFPEAASIAIASQLGVLFCYSRQSSLVGIGAFLIIIQFVPALIIDRIAATVSMRLDSR